MYKNKIYLMLVCIVSALCILSCNKEKVLPPHPDDLWTLPPPTFCFQVTENGVPLITDSFNNQFKMYYLDNQGNKILNAGENLDDSRWIAGFFLNDSITNSEYVIIEHGYLPSMYEMKTWYLEYPDGTIDTLYVEVANLSPREGKQDPCYCQHPVKSVTFNGRKMSIHPSLRTNNNNDVYVLDRIK